MKTSYPPSSQLSTRFWQFFVILASAFAFVATPKTAAAASGANYVYHETTGADATGGDHINGSCLTAEPYVDVLTPSPSQAYVLRFKVEYQFSTDRLALYYTTDGSTPIGSYGNASNTTVVVVPTYACTFGAGPVVDICTATIPAQPAGTTVKYILSAWLDIDPHEIFANSGLCGGCGDINLSANATNFQYTVCTPPSASGPANATKCVGDSVTFTTTASGDGPFTYTWKKNTTIVQGPDGNNSYTIGSVMLSHADTYYVEVNGACGSVTNSATLTVNSLTTAVRPSDATACVGKSVTFSTVASGTGPFTYTWKKGTGTVQGPNGNASYTIGAVGLTDADTYYVEVQGACNSVTNSASLTVNPLPTVSVNSDTICNGGSTTLTATTDASPNATYLWSPGGAITASILVSPTTTTIYTCLVSNTVTSCTNSGSGSVTVQPLTTAAISPVTTNPCPATAVTFTATAGGTGPFTYAFRKGATILQAASPNNTFTISGLTTADNGGYSVDISGTCGSASATSTVTVVTAPVITVNPQNFNGFYGDNATFSVTATGSFLSYQWRSNTVNITGATSASYTINNLQCSFAGASYDVVVSNCAGSQTSTAGTLLSVQPSSSVYFDWNNTNSFPNNFQISVPGLLPTAFTYSNSPSGGINNTADIDFGGAAGGTDSTAVFQNNAYDFSYNGAVLNISMLVKIKAPTANNRVLQLGFVNRPSTLTGERLTAFMSARVNSTAQPALSFAIQHQSKVNVGTGTIDGTQSSAVTLTAGNWYNLSITFTNIKGTTANSYTVTAAFQDMGASGTTPGSVVLTTGPTTVANADIVNDSSVFAAWRGFDNAGADAYENLAVWINSGTVRISCPPTNQTVLQGRPYVIRAFVDGTPPYTYQWYKDDILIPGATDWQITNSAASLGDQGAYKLTVNGSVTSAAGTLTVNADTTGPSVVSVGSFDGWFLGLCFNEKVDPATATDPANYSLSGGPAISSVSLRPDGQSVRIGVGAGITGPYTITVSGVKDLFGNSGGGTASGNINTAGLTLVDVNNPIPQGATYTCADGDYELTAGGADVWGGSTGSPYGDQFTFAYQRKTGDFDVRVKITNETYNVGNGGQITKAGIMARETLEPGSPNCDIYVMPAWPGLNRYEAGLRPTRYANTGGYGLGSNGGDPTNQGNRAADHPNSWVRMRRVNDTFTAFTSADGINWVANSQTTQPFSKNMLVGLMMCAHQTTFSGTNYFTSSALFKGYSDTPVTGTSPTITTTLSPSLQPATTNINAFQSAVFTMGATISGAPSSDLQFTWQRSDGAGGFTNIPLANAASATYTTPALSSLQTALQWRCIASAPGALSVTSSVSTVTTITDTAGPTLTSAYAPTGGVRQVIVVFSEPVSVGTADVAGNYNVTNASLASIGVNSATFYDAAGTTVVLTLAADLVPGTTNGVVVNNVRDRSAGANLIAANSFRMFTNVAASALASNVVVELFRDNQAFVLTSAGSSAPRIFIDALLTEPKFINNAPDQVSYTNVFGWNTAIGNSGQDNYGGRITSYFTPATNGNYVFYFRSDDLNRVFMNTNSVDSTDPAGKVMIGDENIACCKNYGDQSGGPNVSPQITLVAGQKYYIEALFKEGIGGDGFEMAFRDLVSDPSGVAPPNTEVATNIFFTLPTGPVAVGTITPSSITVQENGFANFSVRRISGAFPYKFQWFQGANLVPGATALSNFTAGPFALTDTSVTFVVSNYFSRAQISADVTVTADITKPVAIRAFGDPSLTNVTISFSERLTEATATNKNNYSIAGLTVTAATLVNGTNVFLVTSQQTQGQNYTITMNNLQDRAATPNTILAGSTINFSAWVMGFNFIKVELFLNNQSLPAPKTTIPDLLVEPKFIANTPDIVLWTNIFAWNQNIGSSGRDNYGGRLTAYFVPPSNGVYRFYIRSDDNAQLYLNPCGTDPAGKVTIAEQSVACCKNYGDLTGGPNTSSGYPLSGGGRYYMELLFKEGIGGDGATLAWREQSDPSVPVNTEAASSINFASIDNPDTTPGTVTIVQNPADAGNIQQNHSTSFSVVATNSLNLAQGYQWVHNGVDIPGAHASSYTTPPLQFSDTGTYYVKVTIPGHLAVSTAASVTVVADNDSPTLVAAYGDPIDTHLRVVFNELISTTTATNINNYTFNSIGAQSVTNAILLQDRKTVILTVNAPIAPATYTIDISGIRDLTGNPIVPVTSATFSAPWACTNGVVFREEFFGNINSNPAFYFFTALTNNPHFPNNPDYSDYLTNFNSPQSSPNIDTFGTRVRGYLVPTVSGNYTFAITNDDSGWLLISQDADVTNAASMIKVEGIGCGACTGPQSPTVSLLAGYAYYIEALGLEGGGGDYVVAAWRPPGATGFSIIPGSNLRYCLNPDTVSLNITSQPIDQEVLERRTATFHSTASGTGAIAYQWQFFDPGIGDWANVPSATNNTFRITPTNSVDFPEGQNGIQYHMVASLAGGVISLTATSNPAILTVDDDALAPVLVRAYSLSGTTIKLVFDEDLDYVTATDGSLYTVTGANVAGNPVLSADNAGVSNTVFLTLDAQLPSSTFTVSGSVTDGGGNSGSFSIGGSVFALGTGLVDDGVVGTALDPIEKGSSDVPNSNRLVVTAGGSDIWNNADGFRYAYRNVTNDFDVKVRVSRLDPRNMWSKAGIVVREDFTPGARNVNAVLTPTGASALDGSGVPVNDWENGSRGVAGGATTDARTNNVCCVNTNASGRPTNSAPYTNAWIRLRRTGNDFLAYMSFDGINWVLYGNTNQALPSVTYLGLGTTAHNNGAGQTTTAEYNDFGFILPPYNLVGPISQTVTQGGTATFSVTASGETPFTYQWRKGGNPIGGANGPSYTINNAGALDDADYDVIVSNLVGNATSGTAHLTVILPPVVSTDPDDVTVACHGNASFTAAFSGSAAVYQWYYNTNTVLTDQTNLTLSLNNVTPANNGTYSIIASNAAGTATSRYARLTVTDSDPPVITLLGTTPVTVECHTGYVDAGATANDTCAGDLTSQIVVTGSVNPNVPGTYVLHYNVSDPSGNPAVEVTRTVNVVDTIKPTITRTGADPITVECHSLYTDPGATASDSCAGNLTSQIVVTGSVNTNSPGTYVLHYNVSDPSGNPADEVTRTVNVVDTTAPVITCPGNKVVHFDPNRCDAVVNYSVSVVELCSTPTVVCTPPSGSVFPMGITTVSCTATDAVGNGSACSFTVQVVGINLAFLEPVGGWTYAYDGSWTTVQGGTNIGGPRPASTLDGSWSANNSSSEWAGDARGAGNGPLGGISTNNGILTIEDVDIGSGSANNRKVYFTRDFSRDPTTTNVTKIADNGITISFRARLTQPDIIPATDNPTNGFPDGWGIFSDGKGHFNVYQSGPSSMIGFSLVRASEPDNNFNFTSAGLTMNRLNGNAPSGGSAVNSSATASQNQVLPLDPNVFHEFWITIQTNRTGGAGTHTVDIYLDGSLAPHTFNLTAGTGNESSSFNATNYLGMGLNNSVGRGGVDIDFYAYKQGVVPPTGLQLNIVSYSGGTFTVSFQSRGGCSYVVEYKNTLDEASWHTVATVPGDGTVKTVSDPTATNANRFYRVREQLP